MKKKRHALILKLIAENEIATQDELLSLLQQNGFQVTQATVSRDIKELQLVKSSVKNGPTKYTVSPHETQNKHAKKFYNIFAQSVVSVVAAGNMAAIKCYAGTANAACAAIDSMQMPEVLATLAGDDTLFVLCKSEESALTFQMQIETMLSGEN